jgi:hypothetical protein
VDERQWPRGKKAHPLSKGWALFYLIASNLFVAISAWSERGYFSITRLSRFLVFVLSPSSKKARVCGYEDGLILIQQEEQKRRRMDNIVWETEVWLEANSTHMIHFNGPKVFTVYND